MFDVEHQRRLYKEVNRQFRNPIDFKRLMKRVNEIGSISQAGLDVGLLDSVQTQLYYKGYRISKYLILHDKKGKVLQPGHLMLKGHENWFTSNIDLEKKVGMTPAKLRTRGYTIKKIFGLERLADIREKEAENEAEKG